jgi:hypothetical protein
MARQNQRKAELVFAVVSERLVLCRKDSGREQEGDCEGSPHAYILPRSGLFPAPYLFCERHGTAQEQP